MIFPGRTPTVGVKQQKRCSGMINKQKKQRQQRLKIFTTFFMLLHWPEWKKTSLHHSAHVTKITITKMRPARQWPARSYIGLHGIGLFKQHMLGWQSLE